MNNHKLSVVAIVLLAIPPIACLPTQPLTGYECDQGRCIEGYTCDTGQNRCITTGDPCDDDGRISYCKPEANDCSEGCRTCVAGAWSKCESTSCVPTNGGVEIPCNGIDEDCDGEDGDGIGTIQHCSACHDTCVAGEGVAAVRCGSDTAGSRCVIDDCEPGKLDQDGDYDNGCEATCTPTGGGTEVCDGLDNDCNGQVDDMDVAQVSADCGSWTPNGHVDTWSCSDGVCTIESCGHNYHDIDEDWTTGCEYNCIPSDGGIEICDWLDNDCNGIFDDVLAPVPDVDGDGRCDDAPPCEDQDGDGLGNGAFGNLGCAAATVDADDSDPNVCADDDADTCDDCASGAWEPMADGLDSDNDGICDAGDRCPGGDDALDGDTDGTPDDCDTCNGGDDRLDEDGDGTPDGCDICPGGHDVLDSDDDGIADGCDDCTDVDGDGFGSGLPGANGCLGPDCDDTSARCLDTCEDLDLDGVNDCRDDCVDADGDGFGVDGGEGVCANGPDCDDGSVFCGSDCSDSDGNQIADCRDDCIDPDGDGYGTDATGTCLGADCDETSPNCNTQCEDQDRDGVFDCKDDCVDNDGDGYGVDGGGGQCQHTGGDCDDHASTCTVDCATSVDGDNVADCKDACIDTDEDGYGSVGGVNCVTNGAEPTPPYTPCDVGDPCQGTDVCPGYDDGQDADADAVPDGCDICAGGDDNIDDDTDGVPNECDICAGHNDYIDPDGDSVPNGCDACLGHHDSVDADRDGTPDGCDVCPENDDALDYDGDGTPNGCDDCSGAVADFDGDGVPNACDVCYGHHDAADADGDDVPDGCDICPGHDDYADPDGDGAPSGCDQCEGADDRLDEDGDGVPDGCDTCPGFDNGNDADNDGVPDGCDRCPLQDDTIDDDGDGVANGCDLCPGFDDDVDTDGDDTPDGCDCDGSASAPPCTAASDCTSCAQTAGVCQHVTCSEMSTSGDEHQACSDDTSDDPSAWGTNQPCQLATCVRDRAETHPDAIGDPLCVGKDGLVKIAYEFNTFSPSGTPFRIWLRLIADAHWDADERYNCSLTGVTGMTDPVQFWFTEDDLRYTQLHGASCNGFSGTPKLCWAAVDIDSATAGQQNAVLDQGQHVLSCWMDTNRGDEWAGFDGFIFTNVITFVPTDYGPNGCNDNDAEFTRGECDTIVNWGPNVAPASGSGVCEIYDEPVGTACASGGDTCCGPGSCVMGWAGPGNCP